MMRIHSHPNGAGPADDMLDGKTDMTSLTLSRMIDETVPPMLSRKVGKRWCD